MLMQNQQPAFGGKLKTPAFYDAVNSCIRVLRPYSTLRTIANHLNSVGLKTATGLIWNRERLANYIRNTSL
jgi:hypothetical protein